VAEDNELNFELINDLLELDGHRVTWARDGGEALRLARSQAPPLLLLDLHLPVTSGREVLRSLRAEPGAGAMKIMVLSADAMVGTRDEVLAAGADAYLAKPFDLRAFRDLVRELLGP
jgi:two-component system cell cycle response regulator DivK